MYIFKNLILFFNTLNNSSFKLEHFVRYVFIFLLFLFFKYMNKNLLYYALFNSFFIVYKYSLFKCIFILFFFYEYINKYFIVFNLFIYSKVNKRNILKIKAKIFFSTFIIFVIIYFNFKNYNNVLFF